MIPRTLDPLIPSLRRSAHPLSSLNTISLRLLPAQRSATSSRCFESRPTIASLAFNCDLLLGAGMPSSSSKRELWWLRLPLVKSDSETMDVNIDTSDDSWEIWNSFRLLCEHHNHLSVALDVLFFNVVGDSKYLISDTWWQTETCGFMKEIEIVGKHLCSVVYGSYPPETRTRQVLVPSCVFKAHLAKLQMIFPCFIHC